MAVRFRLRVHSLAGRCPMAIDGNDIQARIKSYCRNPSKRKPDFNMASISIYHKNRKQTSTICGSFTSIFCDMTLDSDYGWIS